MRFRVILRTAKQMEESGVRQLDGFDADDAEFQAELVRRRFRSLRGSGGVGAAQRVAMRNGLMMEGEMELQKRAQRWRKADLLRHRKVHCVRLTLGFELLFF